MEWRKFVSCLLVLLVKLIYSEAGVINNTAKDNLENPATIENGTCVKVYYTGDNFYQIECFYFLPEYKALGIKTRRMDTIIYKTKSDNKECFDIHSFQTNNTTTVCQEIKMGNCIDNRNGHMHVYQIPCQEIEVTDSFFLSLQLDKLNIIFKCNIYEVVTKLNNKDNQVKYCNNTRVEPKRRYSILFVPHKIDVEPERE